MFGICCQLPYVWSFGHFCDFLVFRRVLKSLTYLLSYLLTYISVNSYVLYVQSNFCTCMIQMHVVDK